MWVIIFFFLANKECPVIVVYSDICYEWSLIMILIYVCCRWGIEQSAQYRCLCTCGDACRACLTVTSYCLFSTFNKNFKWRPLQVRAHCFIRCHPHAFGCQGAKLSFQTFVTHLLWENPCFSYLWLLWWCYLLPLSWQSPDLIYLEQYCATSLLCWCDLLTASCSP